MCGFETLAEELACSATRSPAVDTGISCSHYIENTILIIRSRCAHSMRYTVNDLTFLLCRSTYIYICVYMYCMYVRLVVCNV